MFKNTLVNMLSMLIPGLIAIPIMAYMSRTLNVEMFGVLLLAYSIVGYAGVFDAGLTRAVIRKIASISNHKHDMAVMGTAIISVSVISLVPSFIFLVFGSEIISALKIDDAYILQTRNAFIILALVIPFFLVGVVAFSYLEGKQLFIELSKYKIITGVLLASLPALMVSFDNNLASAMIGLLVARVITLMIAMFSLKNKLGNLRFRFDLNIFKELLTFGGWITISNIVSPLMVYLDRFILSSAVGASKVAYYNAPADLIEKIAVVPGALARTIFPVFSQHRGDISQQKLMAYVGLTIVLSIILVPLFIFSSQILNLWLGGSFGAESSGILRVLIVGFFFDALGWVRKKKQDINI